MANPLPAGRVAVDLLRVRTARELAEIWYESVLGIVFTEQVIAVPAALTQLALHNPARIRIEVWAQDAATDINLAHSRDVAAAGGGVIISANAGWIEEWREAIDAQTQELWTAPAAAVSVLVKTWTLQQ